MNRKEFPSTPTELKNHQNLCKFIKEAMDENHIYSNSIKKYEERLSQKLDEKSEPIANVV